MPLHAFKSRHHPVSTHWLHSWLLGVHNFFQYSSFSYSIIFHSGVHLIYLTVFIKPASCIIITPVHTMAAFSANLMFLSHSWNYIEASSLSMSLRGYVKNVRIFVPGQNGDCTELEREGLQQLNGFGFHKQSNKNQSSFLSGHIFSGAQGAHIANINKGYESTHIG